MKNEREHENVCRDSLECSAFQFQLITQFIFQKVRNQRGIREEKKSFFKAVNNRANERQPGREKNNPVIAFVLLIRFIHLWVQENSD